jgi:hypothetical protein
VVDVELKKQLLLKTRNWTFSIRCGILSPTYFDIDKMFMVICSFIIPTTNGLNAISKTTK